MNNSFVTQVPTLTLAGAKVAISTAEAEAERNGWALCIAVTDERGELLAFHRMDDSLIVCVEASIIKARTAARVRKASGDLGELVTSGTAPILAAQKLGPLPGGVPIFVEGVVVGAVGVSGATGDEDVLAASMGAKAVGRSQADRLVCHHRDPQEMTASR